MKKTLITLLALSSVAVADTYTWDYSTNDAVMGGTSHGSFTTVDYTPNTGAYANQTITTLKYSSGGSTNNPNWYETGTSAFYNAINSAISGNGMFTISGAISHGTATTGRYTTILHIGSNDHGLSLGLQGNMLTLTNANVGSPGIELGTIPLNSDANKSYTLTDFSVSIGEGGTVTYSIGNNAEQTAASVFTTNWDSTLTNNYQYTIGSFLPGDTTNAHYVGQWWGNLAPLTITIPEPTTATLSLLALASLATRRRRK